MKITRYILLALLTSSFFSCEEKKESTKIISTEITVIKEENDTISMNSYTNEGTITVNGAEYKYSYLFTPSDSLPIVKNSAERKYYDNSLKLTISKGDETIFSKTFTKNSFKEFIPDELYSTIVLMGFNFNYNMEEKKDNFYFVASIGDPDDEEFHIPIDITITPQKEVKLKKFVDTESGSQSEGMNVDPDTEGGV
jgi:hypothetical protein